LRHIFASNTSVRKYELGLLSDAEFLAGICDQVGGGVTQHDFLEAWNCIFAVKPLLSGMLLSELAQKYPLWIVSNTNRMHFGFIRERYAFLTKFTGWILSFEVGAAKPDPLIFTRALQRAQFSASDVVFVDDQLPNVESARRLGIDAFQFLDAEQTEREFRMRDIL
jgi:putative hydrolase of the HAD superfamily